MGVLEVEKQKVLLFWGRGAAPTCRVLFQSMQSCDLRPAPRPRLRFPKDRGLGLVRTPLMPRGAALLEGRQLFCG